jgi:hypothetical protein
VVAFRRPLLGIKYLQTYVESVTKMKALRPMKLKPEQVQHSIDVMTWSETQTDNKVKQVKSDLELLSYGVWRAWLRRKGVEPAGTPAGDSRRNYEVEGFNRTIMDDVRATLISAKQPPWCAVYAAKYCIYMENRLMGSDGNSPASLFYGRPIGVSHCRTYGMLGVFKDPSAPKDHPQG